MLKDYVTVSEIIVTSIIGIASPGAQKLNSLMSSDDGDDFSGVCRVENHNSRELSTWDGLTASSDLNQWNYKETVTTAYDYETLTCRKCIRLQKCDKTGNPIFGSKYRKTWARQSKIVEIQISKDKHPMGVFYTW